MPPRALALHDDELDREDRAVRPHGVDLDALVEHVRGPGVELARQAALGRQLARVRRNDELGHRLPDRVRPGIAEGPLGGGVELDDPPAVVGGDVAVERRLQRGEPQPLGLLPRRLGELAVGDVPPDALDLDQVALGVEDAGVGPVLPVRRAAGQLAAPLDAARRVRRGDPRHVGVVDRQVVGQDRGRNPASPARASPRASARRSAAPPRS